MSALMIANGYQLLHISEQDKPVRGTITIIIPTLLATHTTLAYSKLPKITLRPISTAYTLAFMVYFKLDLYFPGRVASLSKVS